MKGGVCFQKIGVQKDEVREDDKREVNTSASGNYCREAQILLRKYPIYDKQK